MCGIAGIISKTAAPVSTEQLQSMANCLVHRGPDDQGMYVQDGFGIVHTRLSIIDLKGGHQPLHNDSGTLLVGNGEIYNYQELAKDVPPTTQTYSNSDFEPVVHLFHQNREDVIRQLRGMYGLAVLCPLQSKITLSRDPFGIKPLYLYEDEKIVAFASEPKSFFTAGLLNPEIDPISRAELLNLNYSSGQHTLYKSIRRLLPGETLTITRKGIESSNKHTPVSPSESRDAKDFDGLLSDFDKLFEETVDIHQRSDVPYGMFLSGGIDSSAILTMMARLNDSPVTTFTCGFEGSQVHDEREAAQKVAKSLGAEYNETLFGESDFWSSLYKIAKAFDDPCLDYAILPTYKLAKMAKDSGLKVILSGEGGDELFAGYGRYRAAARPWWLFGKPMRLKGMFEKHDFSQKWAWKDRMQSLYDEAKTFKSWSRVKQAQYVDIHGWLPADLLLKLDRCLMAHSVEGRTPFLDPVLGDFAFNLPDSAKIQGKFGKYLLRKWLQQHCPAAEAFGKKKGFTVPVGQWIYARREKILGTLHDLPCTREIFSKDELNDIFSDSSAKSGRKAWSILFYSLWHQVHMEGLKENDSKLAYLHG
ncbi:MAG: asparagine synthase (glutamine-hydrolyzing) [Alphaproteobacteria bacterium]